MKNYPGGVDDLAQRKTKTGPKFAVDGGSQSLDRQVDLLLGDGTGGDLFSKAVENSSDRCSYRGLAVAAD